MAGITDLAFRTLMRRRGSAVSVTELVSADGLIRKGKRTLELAAFHEEERPIGIQIFGADLDVLLPAVDICQELGADFVDMNFGCPVPKVVKKGAGAAMTRDPERLEPILAAMVRHMDIPLTIKIRAGWDAHSINAVEVARAAESAGCAWVAIHGRTRAQGYTGYADWELIREVAASTALPVIGNGDILEADEALRRCDESGCAAVMVGRGALRNPWMFLEAKALEEGRDPPDFTGDFLGLLDEHRALLDAHHNERHALLQMKKFSMWYSFGYPGSRAFRGDVFKRDDIDAVHDAAREYFASVAHLSVHDKDRQPFLKGGHG